MATNRRLVPSESDFYPTPAWVTEALMECEYFDGKIWEPCCGDGAMSEVLKQKYDVISTDLHDRGYGSGGIDFLQVEPCPFDNIVTNPPFNIAEDIFHKAYSIATRKVALLLRLAFLEGGGRYLRIFDKHPPARLHVFSERVTMYPGGAKATGTGTTAYAWFVWDKLSPVQTRVFWIPPGRKPKKEKIE